MQEPAQEQNIVETLRAKFEESDVKQYLKSSLGGYTRSSVMDYLNLLKKQQQAMAETFVHNQQALFDEKEALKKANDALKARLNQLETENRSLSERLLADAPEGESLSEADIAALRRRISALETALAQGTAEQGRLENALRLQQALVDEAGATLARAEEEKQALRERVRAEQQKVKERDTALLRLNGSLAEKDDEIKFLSAAQAEGRVAELSAKVRELTEELCAQRGVLSGLNGENELKARSLEALSEENAHLKQRGAALEQELLTLRARGDKYQAASQALTEQLEAEFRRGLALIQERSAVRLEKLAAERKLDEARAKLLLLELQNEKTTAQAQKDSIFLGFDRAGSADDAS